jgi:Zn-finger nucleic acid-binding protein
MFFISVVSGERVRSELKYCERCGGLWVRREGDDEVYCTACKAHLAALPRVGWHTPTRREREIEELEQRLVVETLRGVAEEVLP